MERANSNGKYWRLAFSKSWKERTAWTLNDVPCKYVGANHAGAVTVYTFGPIALICVEVKNA